MTKKTPTHPAIEALREARIALRELTEKSDDLTRRITELQNAAAAARVKLTMRDSVASARKETLAAVALGEADAEVLDALDAELLAADAVAAQVLRQIELSEAGIARLNRDREVLAPQLTKLLGDGLPSLNYHAAIALALPKLAAYHEAASQFAQSVAELGGALGAIDQFADTRATPARLLAGSDLWPKFAEFGQPTIPGVDLPRLDFDLKPQIAQSKAELLAALAALG